MWRHDIGQHIVTGQKVVDCGTFGNRSIRVHGGDGIQRMLQRRDGTWIQPVTRKGVTSAPMFTGENEFQPYGRRG